MAQSGVPAGAIRFYMREGLLPRPRKITRNSALYDEAFVARVKLIKNLQAERFLPLKVIRDLLKRGAVPPEALPSARPVADLLAEGHLADPSGDGPGRLIKPRELLALTGISRADLRTLEEHAVLTPKKLSGKKWYTEADGRIVRSISALKASGMEALGFGVDEVLALAETVRLLVRHEIRLFADRVLGRLSAPEIVALVDRVLPITTQLIDGLRSKAQLEELAAVRGLPAS